MSNKPTPQYPRTIDNVVYKLVSVERVDNEETGARMRSKREKLNVSLRTLAAALGVSAPYLSDLERGRRNWDRGRVRYYIDALGEVVRVNRLKQEKSQ